jgi:hypothetical protein
MFFSRTLPRFEVLEVLGPNLDLTNLSHPSTADKPYPTLCPKAALA